MSSPIVVETSADGLTVTLPESTAVTTKQDAAIVLTDQSDVIVTTDASSAAVVEVSTGPRGNKGDPGPGADPVWSLVPNSTLSYDAQDRLERIDYVDLTYKDFTYDGNGRLTTISGPNTAGDTVTITLAYTGDQLTSVTTTVVP